VHNFDGHKDSIAKLQLMKSIQESLLEYRKNKKVVTSELIADETQPLNDSKSEEEVQNPNTGVKKPLSFFDDKVLDLLNIWPMRKWREFCAQYPVQCWVSTICFWLSGQILAAHTEFGFVYFILSMFLLLLLNLGVRKEGEFSAYSVFNPRCERLLGQLTGDHFERDVLMQRRE